MTKGLKHIAVTGAAGQIAYSLLFRLAAGELFGPDQPIALHLLEVPALVGQLGGVVMELEDCTFPLLQHIHTGSDPLEVFKDVEIAFLVGAKPRGPGMERGDLLKENAQIFVEQGKALNICASKNVQILVLGNPCNTNCLIALHNAPQIPKHHFHAMTRLDQNRGVAKLALKANVPISAVSHMTIWGNHSSTQVPDYFNARIHGKSAEEVIKDKFWLEEEFISSVQSRGAEIIKVRGKSSAASAASAAIDAMRSILMPTPEGQWYSSGVYSKGNPYGVDENLVFSFPCRTKKNGDFEIVKDVPRNDSLKARIAVSEKELLDERTVVTKML